MRAIWSGSLSFGLINIPVSLYSAAQERALKFRMLQKDTNCPISYARMCRETNREVPYEDIVKAYEYEKGEFVVLTDDDFKNAAPQKTKTIDLIQFVAEKEIPGKYFNKPYFLEPDKKAGKAYTLLREALTQSKKVGIAKIVMREKEHVAMLRSEGEALMLISLRYPQELRDENDLTLPKASYSKRELDMALMLIEQLTEKFDPSAYEDSYTKALLELIEKKAQGKSIRVREQGVPSTTDMRNLMEVLQRSLQRERRARPHATRAPARSGAKARSRTRTR